MKLSALVLAKNEKHLIEDCLKQLDFADEIIVLDQNSQDDTNITAKKYVSKIVKTTTEEFDVNRNNLKNLSSGDWLLYVDADERIDKILKEEILQALEDQRFSAYYFPRKNFILGKWLKHGGWWPDYVPKLFKRSMLLGWEGSVHESPRILGEFGYFKNPIAHYTARDISSMLAKSIRWAKIEANLFHEAKSPKVNAAKVIKAMVGEFTTRYVLKKGFLDGSVGFIEAVFQALHKAILLVYLWEIQNDSISKIKNPDVQ